MSDDIMLIKVVEKYDWNILDMAREIQRQENMIEHLADKMQDQKKEIKELEIEEEKKNVKTK